VGKREAGKLALDASMAHAQGPGARLPVRQRHGLETYVLQPELAEPLLAQALRSAVGRIAGAPDAPLVDLLDPAQDGGSVWNEVVPRHLAPKVLSSDLGIV
jgi:hypothetical protein